jgi:hypothetical protein
MLKLHALVQKPPFRFPADAVEKTRKSSSFTKLADISSPLQIGLIDVVNAVRERHGA